MTNEAAEAKPQKRTPREKKEAANRVERTRENTDDKDCFTTALEKLKDCQEDDGFFILITTFKPEDAENDKVRGIAFIAESSSEFLVASHDKLVDVIKQDP
ncbi:MAG: hypothetical protein GTO00_09205, partial [Deltaproteobacteria bacterium]|nr:hypothetical protein [Deltaproteobacteria bacterium]